MAYYGITKNGLYLTAKAGKTSWTDNINLAYTYQSEVDAYKIAKHFDAKVFKF